MIHVRDKTKELVFKLNKEGFFGIHMQCRVEGEGNQDYCCMMVRPQFPFVDSANCPYISPLVIDKDSFFKDLTAFFEHEFGSGVYVKHTIDKDSFQFRRGQ